MAITIDTSKPLTEAQIEDLRSRLPQNVVEHYIAQCGVVEEKKEAPKKAAAPTAKKDDLI